MNNKPLVFEYKNPTGQFIIIVAIMLAVSAGLVYLAEYYDRGLRVLGNIRLSPDDTSMLLWGLAILICVLAAVVLLSTVLKSLKPQRISIEETAISAPKASLSSKNITHPYSQITNMGITRFKGQEFYLIKSSGGTSRLLPKAFNSPVEYDLFKQHIAQRVGGE